MYEREAGTKYSNSTRNEATTVHCVANETRHSILHFIHRGIMNRKNKVNAMREPMSKIIRNSKTIQHRRYGDGIHQGWVHLSLGVNACKARNCGMPYHYACACVSAKVQLAVDVAKVVSHRPYRTVEGNDSVVVVLELRRVLSGQTHANDMWRLTTTSL